MSSHGVVVDPRNNTALRLRELDDSRRGARFTNKKEDKLLERRLTYLHNQNKRIQISINREKEFIRKGNPKENDKEMNHLDRRYKEAMGFILDYKTTSVLREEQKRIEAKNKTEKLKQSALNKCKAFSRIRSAPLTLSLGAAANSRRLQRRRITWGTPSTEAWQLGTRLSKMSLESTSTSTPSDSDSSDDEVIYRPFSGKPRYRTKMGSVGDGSSSTMSDRAELAPPKSKINRRRASGVRGLNAHRINTTVKAGFWAVVTENRANQADNSARADSGRSNSMALTARDVIMEQKVRKLFSKVEELKQPGISERFPDL